MTFPSAFNAIAFILIHLDERKFPFEKKSHFLLRQSHSDTVLVQEHRGSKTIQMKEIYNHIANYECFLIMIKEGPFFIAALSEISWLQLITDKNLDDNPTLLQIKTTT